MTTLVRDKKTKAIINTDRSALQGILRDRQIKQDMIVLTQAIDTLTEEVKILKQEISKLRQKDSTVG